MNKDELVSYIQGSLDMNKATEKLYGPINVEFDSSIEAELLELIDITNLEKAILNKELPESEGFFFGNDSYSWDKEELQEQKEDDLKFIDAAKQAIMEGDEVVYSSWW